MSFSRTIYSISNDIQKHKKQGNKQILVEICRNRMSFTVAYFYVSLFLQFEKEIGRIRLFDNFMYYTILDIINIMSVNRGMRRMFI